LDIFVARLVNLQQSVRVVNLNATLTLLAVQILLD
jgi:hypothetical protein